MKNVKFWIFSNFEYFLKLEKGIDKRSISTDQPSSIPPECPLSPWHQNDAKLNKVKKNHFRVPPSNKKMQYLASNLFAAKIPLLLFVIITHFRAACQFLRDSNGPILRSWIFSRISLYIFEKNNHILWIFKNVIKIVFFNQFWNFWCPYRLIRPRQTRFCQQKSLFWNFTKF